MWRILRHFLNSCSFVQDLQRKFCNVAEPFECHNENSCLATVSWNEILNVKSEYDVVYFQQYDALRTLQPLRTEIVTCSDLGSKNDYIININLFEIISDS